MRDYCTALIQRTFSAYPDGFKLYLLVYPEHEPFTFAASASQLTESSGADKQLPAEIVPNFYGSKTSFPGGFLGQGYSSFGLLGVVSYASLVGLFLAGLNYFSRWIFYAMPGIYIPSSFVISFSTLWLWTKPPSTAMLSGGLMLIPFALVGVFFFSLLLTPKKQGLKSNLKRKYKF